MHLFPTLDALIVPALDLFFFEVKDGIPLQFFARPLIRLEIDMVACRHENEAALSCIKSAMRTVKHLSLTMPPNRLPIALDDCRLTTWVKVGSAIALSATALHDIVCTTPVTPSVLTHLLGPAGVHLQAITIGCSSSEPLCQIPCDAFRHLAELHVWGERALELSTSLLTIQPNGKLLQVKVHAIISVSDQGSFNSAIATLGTLLSAHTTLLHLSFEFDALKANAPMISTANWNQFHESLWALKDLKYMTLHSTQAIALEPANICILARACPQLRWWKISSDSRGSYIYFPVSWADFLGAIRCRPRLVELPLRIRFANETANEPTSQGLVCPLYRPTLYVGGEGEAGEIAALIKRVFPSVRKCSSRSDASTVLALDITQILDIAE
jgi:hypothetical protein